MAAGIDVRRAALRSTLTALAFLAASAAPLAAQTLTLDLGASGGPAERAFQLVAILTLIALAPSVVVMATSFTRIVVVLSLLRTAIGTQTAPPNMVVIGLALFLTGFVMAPTATRSWEAGVAPWLAGQITPGAAFERASGPFRDFMLAHVREKDLSLFVEMSPGPRPASPREVSLAALLPAFMISELRRAFEIGFLLFLPFLVIDLAVAAILTGMGMMMLPPAAVSLPFKLIFFVLVDGWHLVAGSLVRGFSG